MKILHFIKLYFAERYSPLVRFLHYSLLIFVLGQIVLSNFMGFDDGEIRRNFITFYGTWSHIITGIVLMPLALVFTAIELKKHGILYFYPYLSGDFSQLSADLNKLMSFKLPETSPKGIAAIIQGLGMAILLSVILSGLIWYLLWSNHAPGIHFMKEIHELLTGLVEAYIIGHGSMGALHLLLSYRDQKKYNDGAEC